MKLTISSYILLCITFYGEGLSEDWGYVNVRPKAYMFWWLYYTPDSINSSNGSYGRPLIIWLQGGPGESSTGIGNFLLIGPKDINLKPRAHTWAHDYNILFIDSPVGAGFSYVENEFAFATSNEDIAKDLLKCVTEFLKLKPEFMDTPVYIAGESYGAKIAIEFATLWYQTQNEELIKSNLKGVLLGNPWISPRRIITSYGSVLLNMGFIDKEGYRIIQNYITDINLHMDYGRWLDATNSWLKMKRHIVKLTNNLDFNNILNEMQQQDYTHDPNMDDCISNYELHNYMNGPIKRKLDINCTVWGHQKGDVKFFLFEDLLQSVFGKVEFALRDTKLKVYIYIGQLDFAVDVPGTVDWIDELQWPGQDNWKRSQRKPIIIDEKHEGYFKKYEQFALYWIYRSGNMVPKNNPAAAFKVIKDLTSNNL